MRILRSEQAAIGSYSKPRRASSRAETAWRESDFVIASRLGECNRGSPGRMLSARCVLPWHRRAIPAPHRCAPGLPAYRRRSHLHGRCGVPAVVRPFPIFSNRHFTREPQDGRRLNSEDCENCETTSNDTPSGGRMSGFWDRFVGVFVGKFGKPDMDRHNRISDLDPKCRVCRVFLRGREL